MSFRSIIAVSILCFINLINYMDRYTIAGVLDQIGSFYSLSEKMKGLIQTSFICSYMIFAPLFGYWGDRYSRKYLMAFGILFWSLTTFLGSFVPSDKPFWFFVCRGLVGIGEASYSTLAPTIIADLYTKERRTQVLSLFYFATPVGSGLGYIVGSGVAKIFGDWAYALRVTPLLGVLSVLILIIFLDEPERGECEEVMPTDHSGVIEDLRYLASVKSYIWSSVGFTCVCFSIGALSWWAPSFMIYAAESLSSNEDTKSNVNFIFGVITFFAGIFGVVIGTISAQKYRKVNPKADPLICGYGVFASVPFAFFAILLARDQPLLTWAFIFISITCLCLNWTLVADMLLYLVVPNRRSFAQSIQILFSHLLGDALSPYIVGLIFDACRKDSETPIAKFVGLQYALYINCFVLILGGFAFVYTAFFLVQDVQRCKQESHDLKLDKLPRIDEENNESRNKTRF